MIEVFASWRTEWATFVVATIALGVAFCTLIVLVWAAIFSKRQVLHARQERETALIFEISRRWNEKSTEEGRQAANNYDRDKLLAAINDLEYTKNQHYYVLLRIPAFFEDLGVLCDKDKELIPIVRSMLASSVKYYWEHYQPWITEIRQGDEAEKEAYKYFEKLASQM